MMSDWLEVWLPSLGGMIEHRASEIANSSPTGQACRQQIDDTLSW